MATYMQFYSSKINNTLTTGTITKVPPGGQNFPNTLYTCPAGKTAFAYIKSGSLNAITTFNTGVTMSVYNSNHVDEGIPSVMNVYNTSTTFAEVKFISILAPGDSLIANIFVNGEAMALSSATLVYTIVEFYA